MMNIFLSRDTDQTRKDYRDEVADTIETLKFRFGYLLRSEPGLSGRFYYDGEEPVAYISSRDQ